MSGRPRPILLCIAAAAGIAACSSSGGPRNGTLAELHEVNPDLEDVRVEEGLELAAESYRRYLEETEEAELTPEAMRRLADLQVEQAYGVLGSGEIVEMAAPEPSAADMAAPETSRRAPAPAPAARASAPGGPVESESDFERRATARESLLSAGDDFDAELPEGVAAEAPAGPVEAIATYRKILERYPNYERNDQVLYQMSRAYDELGQPNEAMQVMDRLVAEYPYSRYIDEVHFRRGEYFFVRKRYLDAEDAYGAIIRMGATSSYYELALYKLGWTLYKQELYEEALHRYMAMLDYRQSIGFDFDQSIEADQQHRIADTFRVISLSFSNLGGPEVVDTYFAEHGHRSYAHRIYANLGEFYFSKLRYADAASVYKSFIELEPFHRESPNFSMRVVEIYFEGGFPRLVVESKKEFAERYALDAEYWNHFDAADRPEVVGFLKTNLNDLANHYHALYQEEAFIDEQPANFAEATHWYREYLASFAEDETAPAINYQLADLLLENGDFGPSAREYERTAYDYPPHEQAAAAGYAAVYAYRQDLDAATGARRVDVREATVQSSLRFADTFPDHEEADVVLGAAADDLYAMQQFQPAIDAARKLIERYPGADNELLRSGWVVIAHSSIDIAEYAQAEHAYLEVLARTPEDSDNRPAVVDGLAAAIYKQGEQALALEDYRTAANHFLRIKELAPTSDIRSNAEYDAAAALIRLEDWTAASGVLEEFRSAYPGHELNAEATKQLAYVYREDGQIERSAAEHERIAAEAGDPELAREALLTAGDLFDEAGNVAETVRVYERYVSEYPRPLDIAMETRSRLAEIFKSDSDYSRYYDQLGQMVAADAAAGDERTDRSRFLAAKAALVLAQQSFERFAALELVQPFEQSLAEKQRRMDAAMDAFEALVDYEVSDVTAAATFYIAEIYFEFSNALMQSERPEGLTETEAFDYEMVIEEEAYPFEERAIGVHEANYELLAGGVYNDWVQKSLDKLALLMPGRYAKAEISGGYVSSIDSYAYRMPIAPSISIDDADGDGVPDDGEAPSQVEATAQVPPAANRQDN